MNKAQAKARVEFVRAVEDKVHLIIPDVGKNRPRDYWDTLYYLHSTGKSVDYVVGALLALVSDARRGR